MFTGVCCFLKQKVTDSCSFLLLCGLLRTTGIDYLQGTKDFDLPYSQGLCQNLKIFCGGDGCLQLFTRQEWKPTSWDIPKAIVRDGSISDNIWENKHWSCC